MSRPLLIAAAAACLVAALPAAAQSYSGWFTGVITSGNTSHSKAFPPEESEYSFVDLTGTPITINFSANVSTDVYDPWSDTILPKVVVNSATVFLNSPLTGYSSTHASNDIFDYYSYVDWSGDQNSGSFFLTGPLYGNEPDFWQRVVFSFGGAFAGPGSVGSGDAMVSLYNPIGAVYDQYTVNFNLTSGNVNGFAITPAPEPATWALLILGFGGVGLAMRRCRKELAGRDSARLAA